MEQHFLFTIYYYMENMVLSYGKYGKKKEKYDKKAK